jgi:hypothetical protein
MAAGSDSSIEQQLRVLGLVLRRVDACIELVSAEGVQLNC